MTDPKLTPYSEPLNPDGVWANPAAWTLALNKTVLVIDLVESVRLMDRNEADTVAQWHHLTRYVRDQVLPRCAGRLVKSLGDGLMAEFDQAQLALQAAFALHRYTTEINASRDPQDQIWLRAGLNTSDVYADDLDIYGQGVNLAARVAGLADPGQTVVTGPVRDSIVDGVDADIQDMGESHLKHWAHPVRTWKVWPVSTSNAARSPAPAPEQADLRPCIAVIPFDCRSLSPEQLVIGDLLADGVIVQLSRSQHLRVISRLSTTVLRGRKDANQMASQELDVQFVLSGSYVAVGDRVLVTAELSDTRSNEVIWADRLIGPMTDVLQPDSELINTLTATCAERLQQSETQRALVQALPRLDSSAMMLGAVQLMHRSTRRDLERSQQLLEALVDRHKRSVAPWAWLAKWHIMQVVQGIAPNPQESFQRAIDISDRALDMAPDSALALSVKGHAMCHLGKDVEESNRLLNEATHSNPNDPMARLYSSVWSQLWGRPADSLQAAKDALALSPLDPQRYYFEMMLANSHLAMGNCAAAIELCKSSLSKNRYHAPTVRVLVFSQYESGLRDDARQTLELLRQLQPDLTISRYLASGNQSQTRQHGARVLKALGLPEY